MKSAKRVYLLAIAGMATCLLIIYSMTLATSVMHIDSGELAAVQYNLGIAHPTGYPLFTLIGFIFTHIPLGEVIIRANVLNMLFSIAATAALFSVIHFVFTKIRSGAGTAPKINLAAAIGGALILAFTRTFWIQSASVEVYSLHIFLVSLAVFFLFKAWFGPKNEFRPWLIFAIFYGLCFTNHMSSIMLLPGVLWLWFSRFGFSKKMLAASFKMILAFMLPILVFYLFLPVRASADPVLNWGDPDSWDKFIRHVSGFQYQVWLQELFSDPAKENLREFFKNLPAEVGYFTLIPVAFGIVWSSKYIRPIAIFLLITFFSVVLYAIHYDIADLESYYLAAYLVLAVFAGFGLRYMALSISFFRQNYLLTTASFAFFILFPGVLNFSHSDQSEISIFEDYPRQAMGTLPQNSILLSYQWDGLISPAYYLQFVEGYRDDVMVVDKELLRRSWYYVQLASTWPDMMQRIQAESRTFLDAVAPFEADVTYDARLLSFAFQQIFVAFVRNRPEGVRLFIGPEIVMNEFSKTREWMLPQGWGLVPHQFFFEIVPESDQYVEIKPEPLKFEPDMASDYQAQIGETVRTMMISRMLYEMQYGRQDAAREWKQELLKKIPGAELPPALINL